MDSRESVAASPAAERRPGVGGRAGGGAVAGRAGPLPADRGEGLPVGEHVFGGDHYPSPPVDERFVRNYVDRIKTASPSTALN